MSDKKTVTISNEEYESLLEDRRFLRALEAAGVDNWEGYQYAFEDEDELNGDDCPVTGGFPLPDDIDESSEYKFILVNDKTGEFMIEVEEQEVAIHKKLKDQQETIQGLSDKIDGLETALRFLQEKISELDNKIFDLSGGNY